MDNTSGKWCTVHMAQKVTANMFIYTLTDNFLCVCTKT